MADIVAGIMLFSIGNLLILLAYVLEAKHPSASAYSRFLGMVVAIVAVLYLLVELYLKLFK